MIKRDFGSDAVILHSRTINKGGLFGLFSTEMVEVMAGADINIVEPEGHSRPPFVPKITATANAREPRNISDTAYTPKVIKRSEEVLPVTIGLEKKVNILSQEMEDIKETLNLIVRKVANSPHPMISPKLILYYKYLEQIGMGEDLIINILQELETNFKGQELENIPKIFGYIKQKVTFMLGKPKTIDLESPHAKRLVALVGPTGVGKTTTIAKMAANFSLIQKKNVALITIDTFRIAAIEQLRDYANIIGIPLAVVFSLDDFSKTLRKFKSADLILIDTAGRSPRNNEQILELKKFLKSNYIDTHLVMSATAKPRDILSTIKRYEVLGGDNVIFTKLDETDSCGVMVDVVAKYHKKLSYFTNGQNVPDDFEVAEPFRITDIIFADAP